MRARRYVGPVYSMQVSHHVRASRAVVYRALLSADAVAHWRVPDGMSAEVQEFTAREGGRFRVSLTYDEAGGVGKSTSHTDTYHGHFATLVPDRKVVEVLQFEAADPAFQGSMTITTTLTDRDDGTDVLVTHDAIPDSIPRADNDKGTRTALARLAALVEAV